jgi:type IV pilus assembly protein PilC
MPTFTYVVRDARGAPARGLVEAEDASRAQAILQQQGYFITALRPRRTLLPFSRERHPRPEDIVAFTHEFAALIGAGLPLLATLQALREQTDTPIFAAALQAVQTDVQAGRALSQALVRHPRLFSDFYVGMIRAGEAAGALDWTLQQLATYLEREVQLRRKLQGMLIYPAIVLSLAVVVTGVFTALIIPAFERVYRSAGARLPLPTLVLIGVSHFIRTYGPELLLLGAAGVIATRDRWRRARPALAQLVLRLPHVGRLARLVAANRFIRTLGMMLRSGVPVLSGLDVAAQVVDHPAVAGAAASMAEAIQRGRRLSEPMRGNTLFPPVVTRMVAVGERSGTLDEMLERAAEVLDRDIEYALQRTVAYLEPTLTLVLGAVIGFLLIALYLPIFGLGKAVLR